MQVVADWQEIARRDPLPLPAGSGTGWTDQELPSQDQVCSMRLFAYPTAMQSVAETQETPVSWALVAPDGNGTGWIVHELAALATPGVHTARAAAASPVARVRRMICLLSPGASGVPQV